MKFAIEITIEELLEVASVTGDAKGTILALLILASSQLNQEQVKQVEATVASLGEMGTGFARKAQLAMVR